VYSHTQGYAPLSIRLVEAAALRGGWSPIADALSLLPGSHFDVTQACDEEGRPTDCATPPAVLRQQQQAQQPAGSGARRGVGAGARSAGGGGGIRGGDSGVGATVGMSGMYERLCMCVCMSVCVWGCV
jgi:hypothetical protein